MKRYDVFFDKTSTGHATHYGPSILGFLFGPFRHMYHGDWATFFTGMALLIASIIYFQLGITILAWVFCFFSNQWLRAFYRKKYGEPIAVQANTSRQAVAIAEFHSEVNELAAAEKSESAIPSSTPATPRKS